MHLSYPCYTHFILGINGNLTEVSVGQSLEQAGLLVARWCSDTGSQRAQISLCDLQGHVSRCSDIQL